MHRHPRTSYRVVTALAASGLLALAGSGCSRSGKAARLLEQAERDFAAGQYDKAEIEYKNVLQADGGNAVAIAHLGHIFHEQGREARSLSFLAKAKELQPDNDSVRLDLALAFLATGAIKEAREEALHLLGRPSSDEQVPMLLVATSTTTKELDDAKLRLRALPAAKTSSGTGPAASCLWPTPR
jgi:predicted Zn-dependent protease